MNLRELINKKRLYLDGGTGTMLQKRGLKSGEGTEEWSITHPEEIIRLHREYLSAGSDIFCTNTFSVNCLKQKNFEDYIKAAFDCANKAREGFKNKFIAFDLGPTGRLLKPLGDLDFDMAVEVFAKNIRLAVKYGADLIMIETMNDLYETKAAVIAAKENCDLPIFVSNAFGEDGKLMTGADADTVITTLSSLGVDAIGLNCSFGPDKMLPVVKKYAEFSPLPIIVKPNAGLPHVVDGKTVFDIDPERFGNIMTEIATVGGVILGGCCGTTPNHIKALFDSTNTIPCPTRKIEKRTVVSSYTHTVEFGKTPVLIGERINPTGKKKIKEALRQKDYNFILNEGIRQVDLGVHLLDVNAGLPEIDEAEALSTIVFELQSITDTPLQIDTTNPKALEKSLRLYNGKPLVNSVNGTATSMSAVFPLVKKYGGAVIALTIGENGIPETAEGRLKVAETIVKEAEKYGIDKSDIIVDPLTLTVSSDPKSAKVTLDSVKLIREKLGVCTSLGVSNISFGLPERDRINSVFFTMCLQAGLDAAIMNPFSDSMMTAYHSYKALTEKDENFQEFIAFSESGTATATPTTQITEINLKTAIIKGLKDSAAEITAKMLETADPMSLISEHIVPALNEIGTAFEQKKAYLPQLLIAADAASSAFSVIKEKLPSSADESKKIVIATVKGDIHDIGKNIVKVLLENYGFYVVDLGRDVDPETVVENAKGAKMVALSALMTTTVPAMEETIRLLRKTTPETKIMVGGAVLTQTYADMIGADFYGKDAMDAVRIAQKVFDI
ncbi:MAG: homocysteine S-methyltransferase family protein [Clostridia bacterium]|nr:homocysteine S-methyltransferase family protein [Clostridia bacterium]